MVQIAAREIPEATRNVTGRLLEKIEPWYESQRSAKTGNVNTNVMCAGLYITEFLATHFPLTKNVYATRSQVKDAGGGKARAVLADHGISQKFTREGGRTSRATLQHASELAEIINEIGQQHALQNTSEVERQLIAALLQSWFVDRVRDDYFDKQKVSAEINPNWAVRATVSALLRAGRERGGNAAGAIAQHLVGAKLQIRFPSTVINVESYTTADAQTGRAGDFQVGDTAIHVTMSPGESLFRERCRHNIRNGFRPRVLVPSDQVVRAIVHAEDAGVAKQVAIQSIEDFVGTNIEEVAGFAQADVRTQLKKLLEVYNERIEQAEVDSSLKIEIPENL